MNLFTEKLDYLLAYKQMTRSDLSRDLLIPTSSIRNWYLDKTPSVEVALRVAKYFGVTVEWLFSDAGIEEIQRINELKNQPELQLEETKPLNFQEQKLVESFRRINEQNKNAVLMMVQSLEKINKRSVNRIVYKIVYKTDIKE